MLSVYCQSVVSVLSETFLVRELPVAFVDLDLFVLLKFHFRHQVYDIWRREPPGPDPSAVDEDPGWFHVCRWSHWRSRSRGRTESHIQGRQGLAPLIKCSQNDTMLPLACC